MPRLRADADLFALGAVLRRLRESAALSQDALGDIAELHRTFVGGIERGERNVSYRKIRSILSALGVSWQEFGRQLDAEPGSAVAAAPQRAVVKPRHRVRKSRRSS